MTTHWPFVRTWIQEDVVASTSDLARQLIVDGEPPLPLAVRALRQTRGRGRADRRWWSDAGSLAVTIAIDPKAHGLRSEHEPRLALATAVAIIDAIAPFGLPQSLGIRWPNDIEAGGRKLGGILPERLETPRGRRLLIGVGLNVASRLDEAPQEVRRIAVSLGELRPDPTPEGEVERLLYVFLTGFSTILERLAHGDRDLATRWATLDTLAGTSVQVDLGTRVLSGVARGIDHEGALCLATEEGVVRLFGGQVLRGLS
jgi:BirA family biotin operon repressor/biotin-[acetyl-CoA-carboxylase] ligase